MGMKGLMLLPLFLVVVGQTVVLTAAQPSLALPGCPSKCGNLTVPYPFGTIDECSRDAGYLLSCDDSSDPPRLLLDVPMQTSVHITSLSVDTLTISYTQMAQECATPSAATMNHKVSFNLGDLPYTFSASRNKLTVVGCDTLALFSTLSDSSSTGCFTFCSNTSVVANGTCMGEGCCQVQMRKGEKSVKITVLSVYNHTTTRNIGNCSLAFPVQQDWYNFSSADLEGFSRPSVPVVLEWAIGNETCAVASIFDGYACVGGNSTCVDSESGQGYRCRCMDGYWGNPYLKPGCVDVDECLDPATHLCSDVCINTPGNYTCSCPKGSYGDGRKDGKGCTKRNSKFPLGAQVTLGVGLGIIALFVCGILLIWVKKKREYILLREKYLERNGGSLFRQLLSRTEGGGDAARIFSEDELKAATSGFSDSRVLGTGGNGTVYKGFLPNNQVIAIKRSKAVDGRQVDEFINEIIILSKLMHRNVVKILGCCLETKVPLVVYEYIPNGTLFHHLHNARSSSLSWDKRLHVAADTAGAIAYLHSDLSRPIIHRDIKSANILLDHGFTAKVADFGASRLAPQDEDDFATMVQGTLGYLDHEYMHHGNLTDRSDVYSFGVVLAELLTGLKSVDFTRVHELRTLSAYFLVMVKEDRLIQILDRNVMNEGNTLQIMQAAQIARRCLAMKAEERPNMKEVAAGLERLRGYRRHSMVPPVNANHDGNGRGGGAGGAATRVVPLESGCSDEEHNYSIVKEMDWTTDFPRHSAVGTPTAEDPF